jgi:hypothetical protein
VTCNGLFMRLPGPHTVEFEVRVVASQQFTRRGTFNDWCDVQVLDLILLLGRISLALVVISMDSILLCR